MAVMLGDHTEYWGEGGSWHCFQPAPRVPQVYQVQFLTSSARRSIIVCLSIILILPLISRENPESDPPLKKKEKKKGYLTILCSVSLIWCESEETVDSILESRAQCLYKFSQHMKILRIYLAHVWNDLLGCFARVSFHGTRPPKFGQHGVDKYPHHCCNCCVEVLSWLSNHYFWLYFCSTSLFAPLLLQCFDDGASDFGCPSILLCSLRSSAIISIVMKCLYQLPVRTAQITLEWGILPICGSQNRLNCQSHLSLPSNCSLSLWEEPFSRQLRHAPEEISVRSSYCVSSAAIATACCSTATGSRRPCDDWRKRDSGEQISYSSKVTFSVQSYFHAQAACLGR